MPLEDYLERFVVMGNIDDYILSHSLFLLRRLISKRSNISKSHLFPLIAGLIFISFKMVEEIEYFSLKDFSIISGIPVKRLKKIEKLLIIEILEFDVIVDSQSLINFVEEKNSDTLSNVLEMQE